MGRPDVGVRVGSFAVCASLTAKQALSVFKRGRPFSSAGRLKFAAAYEHEGTKSGTASIGVAFAPAKSSNMKAKWRRTLQSESR